MSVIAWVLVFATLASLIADVVAIIRGQKTQGLVVLLVFALLVLGLALEATHAAKVAAENRALTSAQTRAQKLIDSWKNSSDGFDTTFISEGKGEGIAQAAEDLMEDVRKCRPQALQSAVDRLADARRRAARSHGHGFGRFGKRLKIWEEAAAAAYQQVKGVAEVPPNC